MSTIRTVFDDIPETLSIPREFVHKKGEVIIIVDEDITDTKKKLLTTFYGICPDFPERPAQGEYEKRDTM
jgi:hypothetical protein